MQKVTWASEVVNLGLSVMWTDMDISYLANPLPFIFENTPDADFVIQVGDPVKTVTTSICLHACQG